MEYKLSITQANLRNLTQEIQVALALDVSFRSDVESQQKVIYVILPDNTTPQQISDIDTIAQAHDPDQLTDLQKSSVAEAQVRQQINTSKLAFQHVAPIYSVRSQFLAAPYGTYSIADAYIAMRAIIDPYASGDLIQQFVFNLMCNYCHQHKLIHYTTPPDPLTDDYMSKTLDACYQLIDSINSQYKF